MIHPHSELRFISDAIGHGVVATRLIPKGTVTWVRDRFDLSFTPAEIEAMRPPYREIADKYTFVDKQGAHILCWDLARYVNHSCRASCLSAGYDFEIAVRDILPGEELTDDYGTLNPTEVFPCACGEAACRKEVRPDDFARFGATWDALVAEAFVFIGRLEQPLWPIVEEQPDWARIEAAVLGRTPIASCTDNRFPAGDRRKG